MAGWYPGLPSYPGRANFYVSLENAQPVASYADVLRPVTRFSSRTRDKPKKVCARGYITCDLRFQVRKRIEALT